MGKVKFTSILLLILVMGTGGCANDIRDRVDVIVPDGVLEKPEFVNVLADIQLIEAASKNRVWRNDDVEKRLEDAYNEVFSKHDITESQFKASHRWWWNQPVAMKGVLLEVTEKITQLEIEAR
ncbi:MAG: DUF4296 domain-containing protein [Flavobacteriales bacterium]|jgi:hypothetical protein|tara:strand:- start:1203 stop:1571 length:369 start_codon:yes stop_codon:yes gene_type:complete